MNVWCPAKDRPLTLHFKETYSLLRGDNAAQSPAIISALPLSARLIIAVMPEFMARPAVTRLR